MVNDINTIEAVFIAKPSGKEYAFEIGGYDLDEAFDAIYKLLEENADIMKYVKENIYDVENIEDIDDSIIRNMEDEDLISIDYIAANLGDFVFRKDLDFNSFEECEDFMMNCEDCYLDNSRKFNAILDYNGWFDKDMFDNSDLIDASNDEDFGMELASQGFIYIPDEIEPYFDYEKYGSDASTDWYVTQYGYLRVD